MSAAQQMVILTLTQLGQAQIVACDYEDAKNTLLAAIAEARAPPRPQQSQRRRRRRRRMGHSRWRSC